jgi:hypothetical protein
MEFNATFNNISAISWLSVLLVEETNIFFLFQVPFGPLAFMPGNLVHTNEILVLLGDDWFVEKSAKQACEVIDRRMKCKLISKCF